MSGIWKSPKRKYFQCWYYDADGNRVQESTGQTSRKAAIQELRRRELEASVRGLPPFIVGRALELAGRKQARKNKAKTVQSAKIRASHIARVIGAGTDLHAPGDKKSVDALLIELSGEFMDRRRTEAVTNATRLVSEEEIRKELGVLRQGLREAAKLGEFIGDPKLVMADDLGPCRIREHYPEPEDFWRLVERATRHRARWLILYAHTGADISELHKVTRTREHIRFDRGKYGDIFLDGGKTKHRRRWVPLSAEARAAVDELLEVPDEGRHHKRVGYLMPSYWDSSKFAETVHPWCDELGIPRIIVKDLRRFYCTTLRDADVPESKVYKLLGHRDSRMLRRIYDRSSTESVYDEVVDALPSRAANMRHDNVVPLAKDEELGGPGSGVKKENA
jgi:integrase